MAVETEATLRLDSTSLFPALRDLMGDWRFSEHDFDRQADEVHLSYDVRGSSRVAVAIGFELDTSQMARLLRAAQATP